MRNETMGQLGKYVRAALGGAVVGLAGGAVYTAVLGLTHWSVSGRGLSSATGPWLVAVGAVMGVLAGLVWAATSLGQSETPAAAGRRRAPGVAGGVNRLEDTAVLRRVRG